MWIFSEVADWVDEQTRLSDAMLDKWVEDSKYSQGVMITAATTHSFMKFGASMTDVLRLGDGARKGGWGWAEDALRFVAIFPFGKAAQVAKSSALLKDAKLIKDIAPNAGICSWVGTTKALVQTGHKTNGRLFADVADLAKAAGIPVAKLGGISLENMGNTLRAIGARAGTLTPVQRLEDILSAGLLKQDGSVVLISVRCMRAGKDVGGHMVYAYYDVLRRVRFMDRTVGAAAQKSYASLRELAKIYRLDEMIPRAALPLHNVFVKSIVHDAPMLVLPIKSVVAQYVEPKATASSANAKK